MSEEEHYHGGAICTVSRCGCPDDSASWPTTRTCPYCKRTASGYRHCPYCKRDYDVSPGRVTDPDSPSAYRRRLMQREQALAGAELIRLDEQYPVWAHSYDTLAWGRQRCAYITGDDDALERMTSHVSEDSPAPWEPAPPAARPPMLIQTAWQDWRWLTAWQELEHPWKALLLSAVAYVLFIASIAIAVAVTG